jgi:YhcH/YjgK/YiaL family protein
MKKTGIIILLFLSVSLIQSCSNSSDPTSWSEEKINKWYESGEYLNGWAIKPDESVNKREFAIAYFRNKERWDKAFAFLKDTDLKNLEVKKHELDGDNLFALVSEYLTRNEEDAKFEAHKKYVDIQYVISGSEQISVTPATKKGEVLTPYDETKDLEFMTVSESSHHIATPEKFFLFFPTDLHRPSVKVGENTQVKKVVVKVKF